MWLVPKTAIQSQSAYACHLATGIGLGVAQSTQNLVIYFLTSGFGQSSRSAGRCRSHLVPWEKPPGRQNQRPKKAERNESPRSRRAPCFDKAWGTLAILLPFNAPTLSLSFRKNRDPLVFTSRSWSRTRTKQECRCPVEDLCQHSPPRSLF